MWRLIEVPRLVGQQPGVKFCLPSRGREFAPGYHAGPIVVLPIPRLHCVLPRDGTRRPARDDAKSELFRNLLAILKRVEVQLLTDRSRT